jgi:hypothetical protein
MSNDFRYLIEAGVYYSLDKPPDDELRNCIVLAYWWKHVETGKSGKRMIWILSLTGPDVMAHALRDLDKLIARWGGNAGTAWKYACTKEGVE